MSDSPAPKSDLSRQTHWRGWATRRVRTHHLLLALVVALAVSGAASWFSGLGGSIDRDRMLDWTNVVSGASHDAIPVTLIDFDDPALARLGAIDRTPRDALAAVLAMAAVKRPLGIFVDLDTSKPGPAPQADAALADMLRAYPPEGPPLALARRFASEGEKLKPLPSIFDAAAAGKPNVRFAASLTQLEGDRTVRRWRLSEPVCEGAAATALPSPALIAFAAEAGAGGAAKLDAYLAWRAATACARAAAQRPAWPRNPDETALIAFLVPPGDVSWSETSVVREGRAQRLFRRVSASSLTGADGRIYPPSRVADDLFAGRFVIVGSSHLDSFDMHATPAGPMPGALIVANSVAGAPSILGARPAGGVIRAVLSVALFALMGFAALRFRALAAGFVVVAISLAALAVLGRIFAPSAAIEITLAAAAMVALYSAVESLWEMGKGWREGLGWRVILKRTPPPPEKIT